MRKIILLTATIVLFLGCQTEVQDASPQFLSTTEKADIYDNAVKIYKPSGFINSDEFTLRDYLGEKVIILFFWKSSCIDCQQEAAILNEWQEKYADGGLQIIGIHTPEFEFEKDQTSVEIAAAELGIKFPIILDNEAATWRAYLNDHWPNLYVIDIDGFIAYNQIGEGDYTLLEEKLQFFLSERANSLNENFTMPPVSTYEPSENSHKVYFNSEISNSDQYEDDIQNLEKPETIHKNRLYLSGNWEIGEEFAMNYSPGSIIYKTDARNIYLLAGSDEAIMAKVLINGTEEKSFTLLPEKFYSLAEQEKTGELTIEVQLEKPGARIYILSFE